MIINVNIKYLKKYIWLRTKRDFCFDVLNYLIISHSKSNEVKNYFAVSNLSQLFTNLIYLFVKSKFIYLYILFAKKNARLSIQISSTEKVRC